MANSFNCWLIQGLTPDDVFEALDVASRKAFREKREWETAVSPPCGL
jgi:hypothetical protein